MPGTVDIPRIEQLCDEAATLLGQDLQRSYVLLQDALALCRQIPGNGTPHGAPAAAGPSDGVGPKKTARIYYLLGCVFARQAEFVQSEEALRTALCSGRAAGDISLQIRTLTMMGLLAQVRGEGTANVMRPFRQALHLAGEQDELTEEVGEVLVHLSRMYCTIGRYSRAERYVNRGLGIHRRAGRKDGEASALVMLGQILCSRGETDKALQAFLHALQLLEPLGFRQSVALIRMNIGNVYFLLGEYAETLRYQLGSLALYETIGDPLGCSDVLTNIGNTYEQLNDNALALAYYNRALVLKRRLGNTPGEATLLNNLGTVYSRLGNREEACRSMYRSLALCESVDDRNGAAVALLNLGVLFMEQQQFDAALEYLRRALHIFRTMSGKADEANCLLSLGQLFMSRGEPGEAVRHLREALALAEAAGVKKIVYEAHSDLSEACEALGDMGAALEHFRNFHRIKEEMFNEESARRLRTMHLHYEVEQSRKEAELQRMRREQLERDMEMKNRELTATTMMLAQKNGILQELYRQVRELPARPAAEQEHHMRSLLLELEGHLHSGQAWEAFEQHFTQIHETFYSVLRSRCAALSPTELKVCALIKLNLSMKEVAALLTVTDMTVKKHRYNIRKKLGLAEGESLVAFLASV